MKYFFQTSVALLCVLGSQLVQASNLERLFAPNAELWEVWATQNATSKQSIDHQTWSLFLLNNVIHVKDGINRINYAAVSKEDKLQLKEYLSALSEINISNYPRTQQLPYWINLYNALTVDIVLQHYPVESIRDIDVSPGFFSDGPWDKKLLKIEEHMVSLNDIEHRIIRPIWKDRRVHYALNCASIGCPNLQTEAYTAKNIDKLLKKAIQEYINHPRGVSLIDSELMVSSIYNWFQDDFGTNEQDVLNHIRQYANPELQKQLNNIELISNYEYDWSLNDTQPKTIHQEMNDEFDSTD